MASLDAMQEYAAAEKRLSIHLAGWRECDLGNEGCEHVQRRNAAYLAYTKKPHVSVVAPVWGNDEAPALGVAGASS